MCVADLRALLRRGLALLAIPPKHLAPPVVGVPRLRRFSALLWVFRPVSIFHHHVFPLSAITNYGNFGNLAAACPPPLASTMIPKELSNSTPRISRQTGVELRQTGTKLRENLLIFIDHRHVFRLWFLRFGQLPIATC
jgi:hypothetical protein